jgi:phenylacetic acid degradation operon negative regulatory protein
VTTTRKPLTARSVLASVLLGTEPPWLPTPLLVRTAELFGIAEGTVRTALSRMAAAGEVEASDGGYRLTGRLLARQARQAASRRAEVVAWDGTWELAVIDGGGRRAATDRAALRAALATLRLAEVREGVWSRPANLDPDRSPDARSVAATQMGWWRGARPVAGVDVGTLWDLGGWAAGARALRAEMAALTGPLEDGDTAALAEGFVVSAAVLRHLQADPLLPAELLPDGWPGDALRRDYDRYDAAYRAVLATWFAANR